MTTFPPGPNLPAGFESDAPSPGGTRRFLIAIVLAALILGGVVAGLMYWMRITASPNYRGPEQLKKPDYPYYR